MKDRMLQVIKKHIIGTAMLVTLVVAIIAGLCKNDALVGICGFLLTVLLVVGIIVLVSRSKKNNVAVPSRTAQSSFPSSISGNGRRYDLKYSYDDVAIVGRSFHDDVQLVPGETLFLLQEPTNQHDSQAVSVNVKRNGVMVLVGYIGRDSKLKDMANDYIRRGDMVTARVNDAMKGTMSIGFYK